MAVRGSVDAAKLFTKTASHRTQSQIGNEQEENVLREMKIAIDTVTFYSVNLIAKDIILEPSRKRS